MTGRKAVAGLSLLSALIFFAVGARSASAANTTAGECTAGVTKDFSDAHCDTAVAVGTGTFGHAMFKENEAVSVTTANDLTGTTQPVLMEFKIGGLLFSISCNKASGTGTVTNKSFPSMTVVFGDATVKFTECLVLSPKKEGCFATPELVATVTGPHNLGLSGAGDKKTGPTGEEIEYHKEGKGTGMGLKFQPKGEDAILSITFSEACKLGSAFVKGSFYSTGGRGGVATSSGATQQLSKSSTLGGLTLGGNPFTLEGTLTLRKSGGNPLVFTTTAS